MAGVCSVKGCGRPIRRKGMCAEHRRQVVRGEPIRPIKTLRRARGLICEYVDCGRPMYARGLCRKHHDQLIRGVELHAIGDTAWIRARQREAWAAMSDEAKKRRVAALIAGARKPRSEQACRNMSAAKRRSWAAKKPAFRRKNCVGCGDEFEPNSAPQIWCTIPCRERHRRAREHGITVQELAAIEERQGSKCGICRSATRRLVIDHDHATGRVRGLLCSTCNTGIGKLGDCADTVARALAYLTR